MDIRFSAYVENDFRDLKEMVFGLYDEDPEGMPITEEKITKTVNASVSHPEKVQIIMIRGDSAIIGYGIVTFSWSNEYGGDTVNIDELYVKRENRNRRVGSAFIRYILATYQSAVLFELEITPSNNGALRLYRSHGFETSANTHLSRVMNQVTKDCI